MNSLCVLWLIVSVFHPMEVACPSPCAPETPVVAQPITPTDPMTRLRARGFLIDAEIYPSKVRSSHASADVARWAAIADALDLRCKLTVETHKPRFETGQWLAIKGDDRSVPIRVIPSLTRIWAAAADAGSGPDDGVYSPDGARTPLHAPRVHGKFYDGTLVDPHATSPFTPIPSFVREATASAISETWRVVGPGPALNELSVEPRDPARPPIRGRCSVEQFAPFIWMLDVTEITLRDGTPSESRVFHDFVFPILDANGLPRDPATDPRASERHGQWQNLVTSTLSPRFAPSQLPFVAPVPVAKRSGAPSEDIRWQERIVIPAPVLAAADNRVFVLKASSWSPLRDDVVITGSCDAPKNLLQVVVGADIRDDALIDLLCLLSGVQPTPEQRAQALEALKSK